MIEVDLDLLPDPVLVVDGTQRLVALNDAAVELLGPAAARAVGAPFGEAFDVCEAGGIAVLREVLEGSGDPVEMVFRQPGGTAVPVTATVRTSGADTVVALRPSVARGGVAIISAVAHELRSPLTSVKGYSSLMLSRWERLTDDQKRAMLEQIHHDADRVTRLVTELLDISRLETGHLVLRRQMVDLAELAASVVEKVGLGIPGLECAVAVPDRLPGVYADPHKVEQVLTNLVENAAKYGSPTGMRVTASVARGAVEIAVHDIGEGIAADDLPRVFEKFFRRDHGRPSGTGLGLWISQGLVEAHGGRLTVTSTPGSGSTFRFTLPTDAPEREPRTQGGVPEPIGDAPA